MGEVDHSSWSLRVRHLPITPFWGPCRSYGIKLWLFDRAWRGETAKDAPGPALQVRGRPQNVVTLEGRSRSKAVAVSIAPPEDVALAPAPRLGAGDGSRHLRGHGGCGRGGRRRFGGQVARDARGRGAQAPERHVVPCLQASRGPVEVQHRALDGGR